MSRGLRVLVSPRKEGVHGWLSGSMTILKGNIKVGGAMQETWVQSLGWENPLEKEIATLSNILAWRIPWTEEPGLCIGHNLVTKQQQHI